MCKTFGLLVVALLLSGCLGGTPESAGGDDIVDDPKHNRIICESPKRMVNGVCCLDKEVDGVCDEEQG